MAHPILDEFGRRLIGEVREETVSDWQMIISGQMKGERAERIRAELGQLGGGASSIIEKIVPEVVDSVLHHLLRWLEEDDDFTVTGEVARQRIDDLAEESDGLAGELYTEAGWIARFGSGA